MIPSVIGVGVVLLAADPVVPQAIKIVREYQRLMVFRLGRAIGAKGPGLVLLIPFVDKGVWVDLRELYLEIPHQDRDHRGQRARSRSTSSCSTGSSTPRCR